MSSMKADSAAIPIGRGIGSRRGRYGVKAGPDCVCPGVHDANSQGCDEKVDAIERGPLFTPPSTPRATILMARSPWSARRGPKAGLHLTDPSDCSVGFEVA